MNRPLALTTAALALLALAGCTTAPTTDVEPVSAPVVESVATPAHPGVDFYPELTAPTAPSAAPTDGGGAGPGDGGSHGGGGGDTGSDGDGGWTEEWSEGGSGQPAPPPAPEPPAFVPVTWSDGSGFYMPGCGGAASTYVASFSPGSGGHVTIREPFMYDVSWSADTVTVWMCDL